MLTEDLKDKVLTRIAESGLLAQTCPTCKQRRWSLSDRVWEFREYQQGGLVIGGGQTLIPLILAFCENCGMVVPFNALILGVVDKATGEFVGEPSPAEAEQ